MGKIFCLIGKSSCGKDTIYKQILSDGSLPLHTLVSYTTRPIRSGETNGVEYYFLSEEELHQLEQAGKIIELRAYQTVHGVWKYFTVQDHQINLKQSDYLLIGTLESYVKLKEYFGSKNLVPLYIEVDPDIRLQRALDRERSQKDPKYAELCRRFLADEADFSPEKLKHAGINRVFYNHDLMDCLKELTAVIKKELSLSDKTLQTHQKDR